MKYTTTIGKDIEIYPIELAHTGAPKYVALRQVIEAFGKHDAVSDDVKADDYWQTFEDLRKALENMCSVCGIDPQTVSIGDAIPLVRFLNTGVMPSDFTPAESEG